MAITIGKATLVSIFVECILYGCFLIIFCLSSNIIWCRLSENAVTKSIHKKLFFVSLAMFIVATVHVGTDLHRLIIAFSPLPDGRPPSWILNMLGSACYLMKLVSYAIQIILGDGFMIYRLHLVWNGRKTIVWPIMLIFMGGTAATIGWIYEAAITQHSSSGAAIFLPPESAWIESSMSLNLVLNICATSLIALRIWWIPQKIKAIPAPDGTTYECPLSPAAVIVIESGVIYSSCMTILIALYVSKSYAQNIMLDALPHIIGIVFSLIIVRVALGVSAATPTADGGSRTSRVSALASHLRKQPSSQQVNGTQPNAGQWHWRSKSADMFHDALARTNGSANGGLIAVSVVRSHYVDTESSSSLDQEERGVGEGGLGDENNEKDRDSIPESSVGPYSVNI